MTTKISGSVVLLVQLAVFLPISLRGDVVQIGASQDNSIFEANQTNSNGAGSFLFSGRTGLNNGGLLNRGLIAFDIASALPAGATITVVTLNLNMSRSQFNSSNYGLHAASQSWGEGTSNSDGNFPGPGAGSPATPGDATWQHRSFPATTWNNLGGDFNPVASGTALVGFTTGQYSWSSPGMVADVQNWLDNPANNFGWFLIGDESGPLQNAKRFDTRENVIAANRPMLSITFTPIPEPSTFAVAAMLIAGGLCLRYRRRV